MPVIGNFQLASGQAAYGGGTSAAAAAAINVGLGFVPRYVKVFNLVAGAIVVTEFVQGDANVDMAEGVQTSVAVAASSTAILAAGAGGITVGDVTVGNNRVKGFTIGAACQTNATAYMWIALG